MRRIFHLGLIERDEKAPVIWLSRGMHFLGDGPFEDRPMRRFLNVTVLGRFLGRIYYGPTQTQ